MLVAAAGIAAAHTFPVRADHGPLRIATILPQTGVLARHGEQACLGIDLAVELINETGGIGGRPIRATHLDNGSDPDRSVALIRATAQDPSIMAAIGPIGSSALEAMRTVVERSRIPLLYATNYEGGACGRYIFSFGTVPNQDLGDLLPVLTSRGRRRIFMLGADDAWPRAMFRIARPLAELADAEVIGEEYVPSGQAGYAHVVARIADRMSDVLLLALPGDDGAAFMREAHRAGLLERLSVGILGFSEVFADAFRNGEIDGARCTVPLVTTADEPGVRGFMQRVRRHKGPDGVVSGYTLTHYNAVSALKVAVERSGASDRESVVDGLENLTFDSPTGPCFVDARDHHVSMPLYLARVFEGRLTVMRKLERVAPAAQCG